MLLWINVLSKSELTSSLYLAYSRARTREVSRLISTSFGARLFRSARSLRVEVVLELVFGKV